MVLNPFRSIIRIISSYTSPQSAESGTESASSSSYSNDGLGVTKESAVYGGGKEERKITEKENGVRDRHISTDLKDKHSRSGGEEHSRHEVVEETKERAKSNLKEAQMEGAPVREMGHRTAEGTGGDRSGDTNVIIERKREEELCCREDRERQTMEKQEEEKEEGLGAQAVMEVIPTEHQFTPNAVFTSPERTDGNGQTLEAPTALGRHTADDAEEKGEDHDTQVEMTKIVGNSAEDKTLEDDRAKESTEAEEQTAKLQRNENPSETHSAYRLRPRKKSVSGPELINSAKMKVGKSSRTNPQRVRRKRGRPKLGAGTTSAVVDTMSRSTIEVGDDLDNASVITLRGKCKVLGISASGKKNDLRRRIRQKLEYGVFKGEVVQSLRENEESFPLDRSGPEAVSNINNPLVSSRGGGPHQVSDDHPALPAYALQNITLEKERIDRIVARAREGRRAHLTDAEYEYCHSFYLSQLPPNVRSRIGDRQKMTEKTEQQQQMPVRGYPPRAPPPTPVLEVPKSSPQLPLISALKQTPLHMQSELVTLANREDLAAEILGRKRARVNDVTREDETSSRSQEVNEPKAKMLRKSSGQAGLDEPTPLRSSTFLTPVDIIRTLNKRSSRRTLSHSRRLRTLSMPGSAFRLVPARTNITEKFAERPAFRLRRSNRTGNALVQDIRRFSRRDRSSVPRSEVSKRIIERLQRVHQDNVASINLGRKRPLSPQNDIMPPPGLKRFRSSEGQFSKSICAKESPGPSLPVNQRRTLNAPDIGSARKTATVGDTLKGKKNNRQRISDSPKDSERFISAHESLSGRVNAMEDDWNHSVMTSPFQRVPGSKQGKEADAHAFRARGRRAQSESAQVSDIRASSLYQTEHQVLKLGLTPEKRMTAFRKLGNFRECDAGKPVTEKSLSKSSDRPFKGQLSGEAGKVASGKKSAAILLDVGEKDKHAKRAESPKLDTFSGIRDSQVPSQEPLLDTSTFTPNTAPDGAPSFKNGFFQRYPQVGLVIKDKEVVSQTEEVTRGLKTLPEEERKSLADGIFAKDAFNTNEISNGDVGSKQSPQDAGDKTVASSFPFKNQDTSGKSLSSRGPEQIPLGKEKDPFLVSQTQRTLDEGTDRRKENSSLLGDARSPIVPKEKKSNKTVDFEEGTSKNALSFVIKAQQEVIESDAAGARTACVTPNGATVDKMVSNFPVFSSSQLQVTTISDRAAKLAEKGDVAVHGNRDRIEQKVGSLFAVEQGSSKQNLSLKNESSKPPILSGLRSAEGLDKMSVSFPGAPGVLSSHGEEAKKDPPEASDRGRHTFAETAKAGIATNGMNSFPETVKLPVVVSEPDGAPSKECQKAEKAEDKAHDLETGEKVKNKAEHSEINEADSKGVDGLTTKNVDKGEKNEAKGETGSGVFSFGASQSDVQAKGKKTATSPFSRRHNEGAPTSGTFTGSPASLLADSKAAPSSGFLFSSAPTSGITRSANAFSGHESSGLDSEGPTKPRPTFSFASTPDTPEGFKFGSSGVNLITRKGPPEPASSKKPKFSSPHTSFGSAAGITQAEASSSDPGLKPTASLFGGNSAQKEANPSLFGRQKSAANTLFGSSSSSTNTSDARKSSASVFGRGFTVAPQNQMTGAFPSFPFSKPSTSGVFKFGAGSSNFASASESKPSEGTNPFQSGNNTTGFGTFGSSGAAASPFPNSTSASPHFGGSDSAGFSFGSSATPTPFTANLASSPFGTSSASAPSFGTPAFSFGPSSAPASTPSSAPFGAAIPSTLSFGGSTSAPVTFGNSNSPISGFGVTGFSASGSLFGQSAPTFGNSAQSAPFGSFGGAGDSSTFGTEGGNVGGFSIGSNPFPSKSAGRRRLRGRRTLRR